MLLLRKVYISNIACINGDSSFPFANTGLIEFSCGECGKSFDLPDDLQSHIDHDHECMHYLIKFPTFESV